MSTVKNINYYVKETDVNQTGNSLNTGSFEITSFFNTAFNSTFFKIKFTFFQTWWAKISVP